ncbi:MAG: DUF2783 domain-containing protein [Betaproteobacteria bacterium]|nr:DUF2783 domain-containing protein [Betaproteobacteria bacterium]
MTRLSFGELERFYEGLALSIDKAGPENESLFLAKLAITLASRLESGGVAQECLKVALGEVCGKTGRAGEKENG